MKGFSLCIGILCLLYVVLGLIAGLLPVDVWTYFMDLFMERDPHTYYKIVPTEEAGYHIGVITAVGVALVAYSRLGLKKSEKL